MTQMRVTPNWRDRGQTRITVMSGRLAVDGLTTPHRGRILQEALEREFVERAIPYERERAFPIFYRGSGISRSTRISRLDGRRALSVHAGRRPRSA